MKFLQDKKIILHIPFHFQLPDRFKKNLDYWGIESYVYPYPVEPKIPLVEKIIHTYKKIILGDRSHKKELRKALVRKQYEDFLEGLPLCDYFISIRPDMLDRATIEALQKKAHHSVAYQWDGMSRYPVEEAVVKSFDKFFIFDKGDREKYPHCIPITNFYFDDYQAVEDSAIEYDVFFVGTYMDNRKEELFAIADFLRQNGYSFECHITVDKNITENFAEHYIQTTRSGFCFEENLKRLLKARAILDLKNNVHNGLSFRVFESVGYKKKLITNNELVKNFDFYHPNNIFIFKDNVEGLKDFLETPYQNLPEEIYEKYSFSNWLKSILGIEPHIKISI